LVSVDAGKSWKPLLEGSPVTMVETTQDGTIYAFAFGKGLTRAKEGAFKWSAIAGDWEREYILHLAVDPTDSNRLIAATGESQIIASKDQGLTWGPFGR